MSDCYAVGDLQGCLTSFHDLQDQIPENAHYVFVGDIVNRGPESLETLREVKALCDAGRAQIVLGNHDLHLLAVAAGAGHIHRRDTIAPILSAPDADTLINWLRRQPLLIDTPEMVFVHAGIPPRWTLETAKILAREAHLWLSSPQWKTYLQGMYGNDNWEGQTDVTSRMRAIFNGFTRMRIIAPDGSLDFDLKGGLGSLPLGYSAWFDCPRQIAKPICFGHWSTLGLVHRNDILAIDTGCLWGGELTAVRLRDRRIFSCPCPQWVAPSC